MENLEINPFTSVIPNPKSFVGVHHLQDLSNPPFAFVLYFTDKQIHGPPFLVETTFEGVFHLVVIRFGKVYLFPIQSILFVAA